MPQFGYRHVTTADGTFAVPDEKQQSARAYNKDYETLEDLLEQLAKRLAQ